MAMSVFSRYRRSLATVCFATFALFGGALLNTYNSREFHPSSPPDIPFYTTCQVPNVDAPRENATFLMLARNAELEGAIKSLTSLEEQFNKAFHYPIVFLNNEAWDQTFIDGVQKVASGITVFGVVGQDMWGYPSSIDQAKARAKMDAQAAEGQYFGGNESYHHMCRFYSGMFYDHESLQPYKWYWRIEPGIRFTCAITYDPFMEMAKHGKTYGYVQALWELADTVPSLFRKISDYKKANQIKTTALWTAMTEYSLLPWPFRLVLRSFRHRDTNGNLWNLCHFFNNFEIADMDFYRSKAYRTLFEYLDNDGGFYYERWGDAPVHSLAVALLLDPTQIHHFSDFGYEHAPFQYCPYVADDGSIPDLSKTPLDALNLIGCNCQCDFNLSVLQPVCLNKLRL